MFDALYLEFGEETVHRARRELTAKNGSLPSYIELLAALYLQQGPSNTAITPADNQDAAPVARESSI